MHNNGAEEHLEVVSAQRPLNEVLMRVGKLDAVDGVAVLAENHEELAREPMQLLRVVGMLHVHSVQILRNHVLDEIAHLLTALLPLLLSQAVGHHAHVVLMKYLSQ